MSEPSDHGQQARHLQLARWRTPWHSIRCSVTSHCCSVTSRATRRLSNTVCQVLLKQHPQPAARNHCSACLPSIQSRLLAVMEMLCAKGRRQRISQSIPKISGCQQAECAHSVCVPPDHPQSSTLFAQCKVSSEASCGGILQISLGGHVACASLARSDCMLCRVRKLALEHVDGSC